MKKPLFAMALAINLGVGLPVMQAAQEAQDPNATAVSEGNTQTGVYTERSGTNTDRHGGERDSSRHEMNDSRFLKEAAMSNLMEIQAGRLATERAQSQAIKQLGQHLVDDHSKNLQELTQLASQKGITLPQSLDEKHTKHVESLSKLSGQEFDRAFANMAVKHHKKDVEHFQRAAEKAQDPDIKAYAAKTLPTLKDHLAMAQNLTGDRSARHGTGRSISEPSGAGGHEYDPQRPDTTTPPNAKELNTPKQ